MEQETIFKLERKAETYERLSKEYYEQWVTEKHTGTESHLYSLRNEFHVRATTIREIIKLLKEEI